MHMGEQTTGACFTHTADWLLLHIGMSGSFWEILGWNPFQNHLVLLMDPIWYWLPWPNLHLCTPPLLPLPFSPPLNSPVYLPPSTIYFSTSAAHCVGFQILWSMPPYYCRITQGTSYSSYLKLLKKRLQRKTYRALNVELSYPWH